MALLKLGNGNRRWYIIGLGMAAFLVYMFVAPKLTGFKGKASPTPWTEFIPDQLPFGSEIAPASIPAETDMIPQTTGVGPVSGMRLAGAGYAPPMGGGSSIGPRIIVV